MTNSGEVAGMVPAAICWSEVPGLSGLYSLSGAVYPVGLSGVTGVMLDSLPPMPGCDQWPSYHFRQEPFAIFSAIGARATCS